MCYSFATRGNQVKGTCISLYYFLKLHLDLLGTVSDAQLPGMELPPRVQLWLQSPGIRITAIIFEETENGLDPGAKGR